MRGLYIHIPFCKTICSYCDFPKQMSKEEAQEQYISFLLNELHSKKELLKNITSVYIGGGTPNSLSNYNLERLLNAISKYLKSSNENTIEVNAELLTESQVHLFSKYHISRVSIGVQTMIPELIEAIKRHHTKEMVLNAIRLLRDNHIQNINLDMMFGLPGQTLDHLKEDMSILLSLPIEHISYYSLIHEEKTILDFQLKNKLISLPSEDDVADMYDYICHELEAHNFEHYEISNFALKGFQSLHNLLYWECEEYVGIGASAASYLVPHRYQNHLVLNKYYAHELVHQEVIDIYEAKREFLMLGLRKIKGINIMKYYERFSSYPEEDFNLKKLYELGLIEKKDGTLRIKKDKIFVANMVFEEFVG